MSEKFPGLHYSDMRQNDHFVYLYRRLINKMGTCSFTESQGNSEVRDFQGPERIKHIFDLQKSYSFTVMRKKLRERDSSHKY